MKLNQTNVADHAISGCALTRADFGSDDEHDETTCIDGGTYWDHVETFVDETKFDENEDV